VEEAMKMPDNARDVTDPDSPIDKPSVDLDDTPSFDPWDCPYCGWVNAPDEQFCDGCGCERAD
jgi:hypothetical protein